MEFNLIPDFSDGSVDSIKKLQEKLSFMRSELKDERKKQI